MQRSYDKRTTEELLKLLDQKMRNFTLPEEKKQRLITMITNSLKKRGIVPETKIELSIEQIRDELEKLARDAYDRM
jgi:hypothetical protein